MIKLCPNCLKHYLSPEGQRRLLEYQLTKTNLYCFHTYTEAKKKN